ncbi:TPA: MFS transporter [Staphylococcus aureus]|nr:MFS transporter [Staphylococcus aureus]
MINTLKTNNQYKKTLLVVIFSQIFSGLGLSAGISVGAILAKQIIGDESLSGLPSMLFTLGSAYFAYLIGNISGNYGRRIGLSIGFLMGSLGSIGIIFAYKINSIFLIMVSLFLYGAGAAANLLSRYAGTDLAPYNKKATSISISMVFTTVGVLAGPFILKFINNPLLHMGIKEELSTFILASLGYLISFLIIFIFMRPDPLLLSIMNNKDSKLKVDKHVLINNNLKRNICMSAIVMILVQVIMISIMTMTPLHMKGHHHSLYSINLVIGIHIASMFLPSLFTGQIIDKFGTKIMIIFSSLIFILSTVIAIIAPGDSFIMLLISLSLLGLAWNIGFISGTTMLVKNTSGLNRAKIQGNIDIFIAFAGALASGASGYFVFMIGFYKFLGLFLVLALALLILSFNKEKHSNHDI